MSSTSNDIERELKAVLKAVGFRIAFMIPPDITNNAKALQLNSYVDGFATKLPTP